MGLLLWATDVHLDHLRDRDAVKQFGRWLREAHPTAEGLVLTGDNAEAPTFARLLQELQAAFAGPVYFVLGNHDYYRGSFPRSDQQALALHSSMLHWLSVAPIWPAPGVALCGSEGWYDARYGDPNSDLMMSDFVRIEELFEAQDHSREELIRTLRARADQSADNLDRALTELAASKPSQVIIATHVPPFSEATWHEGKTSDARWSPFFSSKATGDVLLEHAKSHPEIHYLTLCGHTHSPGIYEARPNLVVYTGRARYGAPDIAGLVRIAPHSAQVSMA